MKIAINLLPSLSYQGIEAYSVNLINALAENFPDDEFVLIKSPFSPDFFDFHHKNVSAYVIPVKRPRKYLLAIAQQRKIKKAMKDTGADILFCPSPAAPFFIKNKIVTIHDCAYDRFPEFANLASKLYFKAMFYAAKHYSKGVITVSEFAKKELVGLYGFRTTQVYAIPLALPESPAIADAAQEEVLKKFNAKKRRYFFYIGDTRPRKNILGLLCAFALFPRRENYKLVLAGKIEKRFLDVADEAKKLHVADSIVQTGFVSDEEKVALYKNAVALIFPSYYEGFGLPVLEAQSFGTPVITSEISSLPEVGGEGALYIDPYNPYAIVSAMDTLLDDIVITERLVMAGYKNIGRFSWNRTATETMAVLRKAANK